VGVEITCSYWYNIDSNHSFKVIQMAAPVTGLDALLSAEAQINTLLSSLQARELLQPAETRTNFIGITPNLEEGQIDYSIANLPVTVTVAAGGVMQLTPGVFVGLA
jgi:hypothetical protein